MPPMTWIIGNSGEVDCSGVGAVQFESGRMYWSSMGLGMATSHSSSLTMDGLPSSRDNRLQRSVSGTARY